jgi:hypothetical protein
MLRKKMLVIVLLVFFLSSFVFGRPVAWWSFDEGEGKDVKDSVSGEVDEIRGNYWYEEGVNGSCLKLDGYTTHVVRSSDKAPRLGGDFTVEAWVAPQTYPWNWTGIVDQEKDHREGFFFGVSADGNVGLGLVTVSDGQWWMCVSWEKLELLKWSHIAATYEESGKIAVYINGQKSGEFSADDYGWGEMGNLKRAVDVELWIGRSHTKMYPKGTEREPSRQLVSDMVFDGLIDEVKIHRGAMDEEEVKQAYEAVQPKIEQPLNRRRFPTEGADKRQFGAYYTTLKYDETWDKLWRMGEHSDVVVTFEKPVRVVFWRGINYAATYVTENEIWMGDQSLEGYSDWGCNEHMSDKQCRYAHVRIIENNPARVIVHWRYALVDIIYQIVNTDSQTQWGDWADEYFVIYPDAVVVRHQNLRSNKHEVPYSFHNEMVDGPKHQFQETILFNQPGTWPGDNVDPVNALTVATMEGETFKCIWGSDMEYEEEEILNHDVVKNATIQLTNLKSKYKPFIIFETGSSIEPWVGEGHSFWNHWPVAQLPSDGRFAPSNDRPSHTSLSNGVPVVHKGENDSHIAVMLYGLTESPIEELVPLARSWNHPPELKVLEGNVKNKGYDKFQRAYVLESEDGGSKVEMELAGSKETPIVNPAFVFKGWGQKEAAVKVDGEEFHDGEQYRAGYEKKIEGVDLVLWFEGESEETNILSISPVD